jgi:hypothetical protein
VRAKNRGLVSLVRRHRHNLKPEQHEKLSACLKELPAMEVVYRFKQKLCYLLLEKRLNQKKCRELAPKLLRMIADLRAQGLAQLSNWAIPCIPGGKKSPPCGDSPEITESPKAFTPKWRFYKGRLIGSGTSTITCSGLRYCVLRSVGGKACPH